MNTIFERRSIRKFKERSVKKDKIKKLLQAAMQAPSAVNQQPWEFIVVENKQTLKDLSEINPQAKPLARAPLAFVLLANENRMSHPQYWEQDMGAATQNILLEAVALNLGSVWLGIAPNHVRMDFVKQIFKLPKNIKPYCAIAIGYPDGEKNKFIDRYDETRVHYEEY